jgi:Xaa-Pro aminopeptidase
MNVSEAFLITSHSNIKYLSGFSGSNGFMLITKKRKILFTDSRYIEEAKYIIPKSIQLENITKVWKNPKELKKHWQKILKRFRIKKIGFEGFSLTVNRFKKFKSISPKIKFYDASETLEQLRAIKTKKEISLIRKSQKITEKTFLLIKKFIQRNKSKKLREIDIAWEIKKLGFTLGAEDISFEPIVAFGKNSSRPHHHSGNTILKKGDLVLIDMGMKYKGYCSDMTRIIFTAKPTKEQKKIYNIVLKAKETAIKKIRPNSIEQKIYSTAQEIIEKNGFGKYFEHGLGHGVGLEIHESPSLTDKGKNRLKQNMITTIEPGIYLPGKFGIRLEDMVLITEKGVEKITKIN